MNDTFVTFNGWVGADVQHRTPKGTSVATLRVGSTPRLKRGGTWVDGETTWYTVTAWRSLADHVADSVKRGDAVIVHGRLRSQTWRPQTGPASTTLHVEATAIGHDLTRGRTRFTKAARPEQVEAETESEVTAMIESLVHETPQMDSWGVTPEPPETTLAESA